MASRYPSFDRDAFRAMSEGEKRAYERRLFDFFPRERDTPTTPSSSSGVPEWLIKGTWITVPHEDAERLTDATRSFANEFLPNREQMVAKDRDEAAPVKEPGPTPPHGDKLR